MKNVKLIAVLAVALVALMIVPAFAASLSATVGAASTVAVDQEITVTLKFTTDATDGSGVKGTLNYNKDNLTYVDGSVGASNNGMAMFNPDNGMFTAAYSVAPASFEVTLKFKGKVAGNTDISLGDFYLEADSGDITGNTTVTPTPTPTPSASSGTVKTYNNGDGSYSWVYGNTAAATSTTKSTSSVPATGDNSSMMWIYIALATLGLAGLGAVVAKKVFAK